MSQVLKSISLQNFRGFVDQKVDFSLNVTLLVGVNGSGKTSILEAIGLLATGQSFRAEKVEEMVRLGVELGRVEGNIQVADWPVKVSTIARHAESTSSTRYVEPTSDDSVILNSSAQKQAGFQGPVVSSSNYLGNREIVLPKTEKVSNELESVDLEVMLTRGEVQGKKTSKRLLSVNGARRRLGDFVGKFATVVFRPEDMRLIEGSPSRRREFLDTPLSFISYEYSRSFRTYTQSLIRRNKLLQAIREGEAPRTSLTYWTESILKHGQILQKYRQQMLATFFHSPFPLGFRITYLPSIISVDRLTHYAEKEIAAGHTLVGPHKDDFQVDFMLAQPTPRHYESTKTNLPNGTMEQTQTLNQFQDFSPAGVGSLVQGDEFGVNSNTFSHCHFQYYDVATYGSRGQQRLAVLWLKLCELYYLETQLGRRPILLLDDILSELDTDSRELVLQIMKQGQSIITTASQGIARRIKSNFPQCIEVQL